MRKKSKKGKKKKKKRKKGDSRDKYRKDKDKARDDLRRVCIGVSTQGPESRVSLHFPHSWYPGAQEGAAKEAEEERLPKVFTLAQPCQDLSPLLSDGKNPAPFILLRPLNRVSPLNFCALSKLALHGIE